MIRHACLRLGQREKGWYLKNCLKLARCLSGMQETGQLLHCYSAKLEVQTSENTAGPSQTWIYMERYFSRQLLIFLNSDQIFPKPLCLDSNRTISRDRMYLLLYSIWGWAVRIQSLPEVHCLSKPGYYLVA